MLGCPNRAMVSLWFVQFISKSTCLSEYVELFEKAK